MSVSSVGASFGFIDPRSIGSAQPTDSDTSTDSTTASDKTGDKSSDAAPPSAPPQTQAISSDTPKFAPATGSALVQVQEKATAA